jgi:nucleoside phosphorylase
VKILLIEDNEDKRDQVLRLLEETDFGTSVSVAKAANFEQAHDHLRESFFDLLILDLLIPGAGRGPSTDSSREIIHSVLRGTATIPPTHIIGLTAYDGIADEEEEFYEENLFSLERYSAVDREWEARLSRKIGYLVKSKNAAANFKANNFDLDFVVLTARYENEFLPVERCLLHTTEASGYPGWPGRIKIGTIAVKGGRTLQGAICCVGEMGMAPAAAVASQAIATFRPRLLAMLGMCCGFKGDQCSSPRKLMDVIIAREVDCWEEGKYVDLALGTEFLNRSRGRMVDDAIRRQVETAVETTVETLKPMLRKFAGRGSVKRLRESFGAGEIRDIPDVKFAPMVSGSSVIADEAMVKEILDRTPKALGLDMELYGIYSAAEKCVGKRPSVLGIKGVADHGQVDKNDAAQYYASEASAVVFKALLPHLSIW